MKKRILVVEDEDKLRRVVELQLLSSGFDVDKAATAEEGLKIVDVTLNDAEGRPVSGGEVVVVVVDESVLALTGYKIPDPNGHYIVYARTTIFWPFNEAAELTGEDSYGSSDISVFEQVPFEELPTDYLAMLEAIGLVPTA